MRVLKVRPNMNGDRKGFQKRDMLGPSKFQKHITIRDLLSPSARKNF